VRGDANSAVLHLEATGPDLERPPLRPVTVVEARYPLSFGIAMSP
jgi:hypothetical protein